MDVQLAREHQPAPGVWPEKRAPRRTSGLAPEQHGVYAKLHIFHMLICALLLAANNASAETKQTDADPQSKAVSKQRSHVHIAI